MRRKLLIVSWSVGLAILWSAAVVAVPVRRVVVRADLELTDTGVTVSKGQTLLIGAHGTAYHNTSGPRTDWVWFHPDGASWQGMSRDQRSLLPSAQFMALVGRIGDGPYFLVGEANPVRADRAGRLYLAVNDARGDFGNNAGSYTALIVTDNAYNESTHEFHVLFTNRNRDLVKGTNIALRGGERLTFVAFGMACDSASGPAKHWRYFGPDGGESRDLNSLMPDAPFMGLIGRVGDGPWFYIGDWRTVTTERYGELILAVNDAKGGNDDNTGSYGVYVFFEDR